MIDRNAHDLEWWAFFYFWFWECYLPVPLSKD